LRPRLEAGAERRDPRKVEVVGTAQTAPMPPTVQEIATMPTQRPSMKKLADTCPS
jgi:hypothetical protein